MKHRLCYVIGCLSLLLNAAYGEESVYHEGISADDAGGHVIGYYMDNLPHDVPNTAVDGPLVPVKLSNMTVNSASDKNHSETIFTAASQQGGSNPGLFNLQLNAVGLGKDEKRYVAVLNDGETYQQSNDQCEVDSDTSQLTHCGQVQPVVGEGPFQIYVSKQPFTLISQYESSTQFYDDNCTTVGTVTYDSGSRTFSVQGTGTYQLTISDSHCFVTNLGA